MPSPCSRPAVHRIPLALLAQIFLLCLLSVSSTAQATSGTQSSVVRPTSDSAAIEAMQNVVAQSGGVAAWQNVRSAEERFSVQAVGERASRDVLLLDDWSQSATRYRRAVVGQTGKPLNHSGTTSFSLSTGHSQVNIPEFDQGRQLASRYPAAAVETMLRRPEYVMKVSQLQKCNSDTVCIDVYRLASSSMPPLPEQQWKISSSTGLPTTIRYQTITVGGQPQVIWREVFFLKYSNEEGVTVPTSLMLSLQGHRQLWTFVSMKPNSGFDAAAFDGEIAQ